ncbi:hypothetical protein [Micromonospora sp. NPDC003776]
MERFEGRCRLEWWANRSTLLGSVEVAVVISPRGASWDAHGRLVDDEESDREAFAQLCDLDPVFTLRFEDASTVVVIVHSAGEQGRFTLTEYGGPHRQGSAVQA